MTQQDKITKIKAIIEGVNYAMMTAVNSKGDVHAWPMTTTEADLESKAIWFIGDKNSDVVADFKTNKNVGLSYATQDSKTYLSITGEVDLVEDKDKLEELWSPVYNSFFERGIEDEDIQLIKVIPHGAEYWIGGSKIINAFKMAAAMVQEGETAEELGEVQSIEF